MGILLRLAWRNLWRHPRRTVLTLGAMVFSNTILVFMIGLQLGMYDLMIDNTLRAYTGHIQIQAKGYLKKPQMRRTVPDGTALAQKVREATGVQTVSARAVGFALASSKQRSYGVQVVGVQPGFEQKVSSLPGLVKQGTYLDAQHGDHVVIGSVLARNLKVTVGDELTLLGSGMDGSFAAAVVKIVGIFTSGAADLDRHVVQMPLRAFQQTFSMGDQVHMVVVTATDLRQAKTLQKQIAPLVKNKPELTLLDWQALNPGLRQAIQADFTSAWFMYGVLIVLVAFSVLNTSLMSVLERTREFGIVLALGLQPGRIGMLILLEAVIMGVIGFALGIALGASVNTYLSFTGFSYPGMEEMGARFNLPSEFYPKLSLLSLVLGPAAVLLATLVAAIYPALRIRRLRPVEAMQAA